MTTHTIEPGTRVRTFWDKDTVGVKWKGTVLAFDDPKVIQTDEQSRAKLGLSEYLPVMWDGQTIPTWWMKSDMRRISVKRAQRSANRR
jgi:hypothetical protein